MLISHINKASRMIKENNLGYCNKSKTTKKLNSGKILFVGMVDSPHFEKWIKTTREALPNKTLLIFPSDRPHFKSNYFRHAPLLKELNIRIFRITRYQKLNFILYYILDTLAGNKWRAFFLARYIIKHKPRIIHFHEMQHGSYIFNLIVGFKRIPGNCKTIISTWGSDLLLYSWADSHQTNIKGCLSWADLLTAEREIELSDAVRLGYKGVFKAPIYITLGYNSNGDKAEKPPSSRGIILLKGHQSNTGRALNALKAISEIHNQLHGFEIFVYSAPESVKLQVELLRNKQNINIKILDKVSHTEMCRLFYLARISISLAESDGLPGVLVEAMQAGAFPIQSKNSAGEEFITSGLNGFLVDPWNLRSIQDSILTAIAEDSLVDRAATINNKILNEKYSLDDSIIKLKQIYL